MTLWIRRSSSQKQVSLVKDILMNRGSGYFSNYHRPVVNLDGHLYD